MLAVLAIGLATTWRFNRYVIDRIEGLAATAERIMRGQMTARAPEGLHVDAFGELSRVFNEMLDQSEALILACGRSPTASRTTCTPLMRMHASISAARDADDPKRRNELLARAEGEAQAALQMFTALIDLARAEAGLSRDSMEPSTSTARDGRLRAVRAARRDPTAGAHAREGARAGAGAGRSCSGARQPARERDQVLPARTPSPSSSRAAGVSPSSGSLTKGPAYPNRHASRCCVRSCGSRTRPACPAAASGSRLRRPRPSCTVERCRWRRRRRA